MSRNGKRARTALTVAPAWAAAGGTAVALQATAQELAAWEAGQDAAYEAAVRKAVSDAEKWRAAAAAAGTVSGAVGRR
ncbi:hypothetical protein GCM10010415_15630 [Streptomyces atrovirens]|uniref:Uncharacterized protein n=1 Tax=Streptomyces atrovirens TaxID=285556 RepID=A0ABW0DPS0_9ACTN